MILLPGVLTSHLHAELGLLQGRELLGSHCNCCASGHLPGAKGWLEQKAALEQCSVKALQHCHKMQRVFEEMPFYRTVETELFFFPWVLLGHELVSQWYSIDLPEGLGEERKLVLIHGSVPHHPDSPIAMGLLEDLVRGTD